MSFVGEAEEFIESVPERMVFGSASLMPFANQASGVAGVVEGFSDGDLFGRESDFRVFVAGPNGIVFVSEARWDSSGQESGAGRATIGACDVGRGESGSVLCNGVNVRCRDFRISLTTKFPVSEVVGQENNDVGLGKPRKAQREERTKNQSDHFSRAWG